MKLKLGILAKDFVLYKSCVFYSSRIRTLVAMATYSFNRLIIGKVEIALLSHRVDVGLWICFFMLSSSDIEAAPRWHNKHDRLSVSELYLYLLLSIS